MQQIPNGKMTIVVNTVEFQGKLYLDIRTCFTDSSGELTPTKKGISIPIDLADDVLLAATLELDAPPKRLVKPPAPSEAPSRVAPRTTPDQRGTKTDVEPIYIVTIGDRVSRTRDNPRVLSTKAVFSSTKDAVQHSTDFTDDAKAYVLRSVDYLDDGKILKIAATSVTAMWKRGKWVKPAKTGAK